MQVIVQKLLTVYERSGKGKTVLLLHGWGDSGAGLRILHEGLASQYTVISLDLPGFGGTQAPATAWGLDEYAQFVQAFLDKIGTTNLWAVVGHSNGGAIAIRGVSEGWLAPERLILLASAGIRGAYKGRNLTLRYVAKAGKLLARPLPKAAQKQLRRHLYKTVGSDMFVAERLQATFKRIVSDDVRADAARLALPVLLIYGETDDQTPVRYGEIFHERIDGSTLEVLPGAGHFVYLDRPNEVIKAMKGFLA